ncbi:YtxH domain-containing protein [Pedobacter sp. MW01-1-1]|uniref:YtxH domain-containing protein n=1 Tax=Pedobacter sp. MW01-1-1 TaxID=3383027 RepID=UPI003FEE7A3A
MGLMKYALVGAAAIYGYKLATKKRICDQKSFVDDLQENAEKWKNRAKDAVEKLRCDMAQTINMY